VNLGNIYYHQRNLEAAAECYRQAVRLAPDVASTRCILGRVLRELGKAADAEASFRRALRIAPADCTAQHFLGLALLDQGKYDEARASLEAALALEPDSALVHTNLGNALKYLQLVRQAEVHFREAIRLDPSTSTVFNNLGAVLADQARYEEALEYLRTAVEKPMPSAQAFCNLSRALGELGRLDESIVAAQRAIELSPDYSAAYCNLGNSLKTLGRIPEAIRAYRTAIAHDPRGVPPRSDLVYALNFDGGYDPAAVFAEHREFGRVIADPITANRLAHKNDRTRDRRLRVGYVSGHYWAHAVNFFVEPILAAHDHTAFEVFCYASSPQADMTTARLRSYADHWRDISQTIDERASQLARDDGIDILVDLAGHIGGNRLMLFARKPAPVQVTYIGYQNTTGMAAMDYRLTDDWADPPGTTDEFYTEKLVRLPRSFFCYLPSADAPPPSALPALDKGHVTFGSFNNFAKVTPQVLTTWCEILRAVPNAHIVIVANAQDSVAAYLVRTFTERGIDVSRVTLADRRGRLEYLSLINQVDIALDPFPFNGHTTTCDALWQGVPVVTLAGRMYAERFGSTAHVNLGLQDLIAGSLTEYVSIAARLAGNLEALSQLRGGLRQRMAESPLLDFAGFTRNLESAYRQMWHAWCAERSS
jgi:predicted O-linked N-acetylglucosamine transferase (SPINDLY family)